MSRCWVVFFDIFDIFIYIYIYGHFDTWCMWSAQSFFIVYKNLLARFVQAFPYWEDGGVPPPIKNLLIHPLPTKFLFPPTDSQFNLTKIKNILFSCSHCSCTIFVLIPYSFKTQIMLIWILIDVQYLQSLNRQNHSSSGFHHLVKKIRPAVFTTFWHKVRETLKILGEKEQ